MTLKVGFTKYFGIISEYFINIFCNIGCYKLCSEHASYDFFMGLGRSTLLALFGFGLKNADFFERAVISAEENVKLCEKYRKKGSISHDRILANIGHGISSKIGNKISNLTSVLSSGFSSSNSSSSGSKGLKFDIGNNFDSGDTYTEVEAIGELAYLQSLAMLAASTVMKDMKSLPGIIRSAINGKLAHSCLLRVEQLFHEQYSYGGDTLDTSGRIKWQTKDGQVNFNTGNC